MSSAGGNILVVGSAGQVGQELLQRAHLHGLSVTGMDLPDIDITQERSVAAALERTSPALLINAAAYTAVDKAESDAERARAVNATGPELLAKACAGAGIPLFHISTDYVFDGAKTGPYDEDDPVAPLGVYGASKAAGDDAVRATLSAHIILRTAWVYSPFGGNFVKTMLRLASERDALTVVDDQLGCPTAAADIAGALLTLGRRYLDEGAASMSGKWGTYHFCSGPATSWCGFAAAIMAGAAARGAPAVPVRAIATADYPTAAARPANSTLACGRIGLAFGIYPREWQLALDETLDRLLSDQNSQGAKQS